MAPYFGQGIRRSANRAATGRPPNHVYVDSVSLGRPQGSRSSASREGSRARETRRKGVCRERRNELKLRRSSSQALVTYDHGGEERGPTARDGAHVSPSRPQQGCSQRGRITRDEALSTDGVSVQPLSLSDGHQGQAVITDDAGAEVDHFADLFRPEPPPPPELPRQCLSTKPIQYGSSHHLPFNRYLHPPRPVKAATGREPIRMVNSYTPCEPDLDGPLPDAGAQPTSSPQVRGPGPSKHPVNTYKGKDPIKRLVQNKKLQCVLAGKPLPKPRKTADRMVLKCSGKQEFR